MNEGRAKELFFIYHGNEFFMWKDGDLEDIEVTIYPKIRNYFGEGN